MRRSTRRLFILLATVPALLFLFAWLYMLAMEHIEGSPRSFGHAVEFVSETLTSTGYGADSHWEQPLVQAFVVLVQFAGLAITILIFPVFVVPFIEERFESRLRQTLPELDGAVLVYHWGPAVAPLVERLEQLEVPVVVIEENLATARRLHDRGRTVVNAQLEEEELDFTRLGRARGIVAGGDDPANAVLTLTARQQGFTGPIAVLVGSPARRAAMQRAGASAVFTPSHILAAALAARASHKINPRVSGAQTLGRHLQIAEVRIDRGSPLVGKTLAESNLRAQTGTTIVGCWRDGELRPPPGPNEKLVLGAILVAAGSDGGIEKLGQLATPVTRRGPILVVGHDEVASKVAEFLTLADEQVTRLSPVAAGSATVGDPLDPSVLEGAGIKEARAVILALDTDGETLFAAALARDLAPETTIVAAARRAENVARIRRAGADFALSVGQVAGQVLAYQLLGEEVVALEGEIRLVRTAAGELAGRQLAAARIRERTDCSIVAIERGEDVIIDFGADFEVSDKDALYVTGSSDHIHRFFEAFPGTHA
jgi:Trk K+ transport system NAD-binding subunit